ncbi:hypothetical protein OUZ56_011494 [Daphnia magna]|uniref:Uncharacterized protein n=1 Tax=Daphnia magna TaxID=35525 RepID=A0ABQ9Z1K5_9CRUS|nr:hypothetical protein OUZ56_011494 [Daphnia magna]
MNEDSNDSRLDEDKPRKIVKLVREIHELTLPSGDHLLHYDQIELLNKTNTYLEQENQLIKKKVNIGVTHDDQDTSKRTSKKIFKNTFVDAEDFTLHESDDENVIKVTKYGYTDKLITEWLKGAEHIERNNLWEDDQKIRFLSDRLTGEAIKCYEDYAEEQEYELK